MSHPSDSKLLVACLCAEWCKTCREYRPAFEALAGHFPDAELHWVDVEDDANWLGDVDVETFPTLLVQRGEAVLFFGPMLPQPSRLQRLVASLAALSDEEVRAYVADSPERRAWQAEYNLRPALRRRDAA